MALPHRLVISCPDRPGVVATVAHFLFDAGANIVHSDQHSTHEADSRFFMRIEFEEAEPEVLAQAFTPVAAPFEMDFRFVNGNRLPRLAIFASREEHCLHELLWQIRAGDIPAEVALVVSNHPDLAPLAEHFGARFECVPVDSDDRAGAESRQRELCARADCIVLARYMQIVSKSFVDEWYGRLINIHHSFLPAFVGANPYAQAYRRGVKRIGATAHYVTEELDAGPIIEQDVIRVDHRAETAELRRLGRQVERAVLARAVKWHVEDRIFLDGNRTVVFG